MISLSASYMSFASKDTSKAIPQGDVTSTDIDLYEAGILEDDEDLYYLQQGLRRAAGLPCDPCLESPKVKRYIDKGGLERHQLGTCARTRPYIKPIHKSPSSIHTARNLPALPTSSSIIYPSRTRLQSSRRKAPPFQFRRDGSKIDRTGVFATRDIPCNGERLIQYVGEVITTKEADRRESKYPAGDCYMFQLDEDLVVDATLKGNEAYVFPTFNLK